MEKFVSKWADGKTLPKRYIFPDEQRPGDLVVPSYKKSIPVIDLHKAGCHDHALLVQNIFKASKEFGSFQVINHGVSKTMIDEVRGVYKEFFELPIKDNSRFCSNDDDQKFHLYTSSNEYDIEEIHLWRDVLRQKCTPLEDCIQYWPEKPARYREVVAEYVSKVNEIGSRFTELICEGLGLEPGYFADEMELELEAHIMVNHYPPCPDPRLTLGLDKHSDRTFITIIMQGDVPGLQFEHDEEWIGVDPNPEAFVIVLGNIAQVISNGKLKSGEHRVVTNAKKARESVSLFILPKSDCFIEPAKALVNADNPALYKGFKFQEFLISHAKAREVKNCELSLKPFKMTL